MHPCMKTSIPFLSDFQFFWKLKIDLIPFFIHFQFLWKLWKLILFTLLLKFSIFRNRNYWKLNFDSFFWFLISLHFSGILKHRFSPKGEWDYWRGLVTKYGVFSIVFLGSGTIECCFLLLFDFHRLLFCTKRLHE